MLCTTHHYRQAKANDDQDPDDGDPERQDEAGKMPAGQPEVTKPTK